MRLSPRLRAILQALFVTLLWSSSWVLIKRYIALLESDSEIKASLFGEIGQFLERQGLNLHSMVDLSALEQLKYLDSSLSGDLDQMTGDDSKTDDNTYKEYLASLDDHHRDRLQ